MGCPVKSGRGVHDVVHLVGTTQESFFVQQECTASGVVGNHSREPCDSFVTISISIYEHMSVASERRRIQRIHVHQVELWCDVSCSYGRPGLAKRRRGVASTPWGPQRLRSKGVASVHGPAEAKRYHKLVGVAARTVL